jgi:hypothetical protein
MKYAMYMAKESASKLLTAITKAKAAGKVK